MKDTKEEKSKEQEKREGRVCYFWLKGKCKFGQGCRNVHPELCKTIMEEGKCQENCGKYHPRICNAMKQNGFCFRGQSCYYTHFGDKRNRDTNSSANNQRNHHYERRQNPHTDRRKSMHNQQWQQNTREAYHYDNHS